MRILMVVPQFPFPIVGGLEKQAQMLSAELALEGHRVEVISGKISPDQPDYSRQDGVIVHRLPWPRNRFYRWVLLWPLVAVKMVRLIRCNDIVHSHVFSGFGLASILLARIMGRPVLVKLPNSGMAGIPGLMRSQFGGLKVRIFKASDAVVAMSAASIEELNQINYDHRRILATPNGIKLDGIDKRVQRSRSDICRIVFLGRLHPAKGISDLIDAVSILQKKSFSPKFLLDIYGEGEQRAEIESKISKNNLAEIVTLRGHKDRAAEVLGDYDLLVLPSWREGNSNVVLEAMSAGLPVISTMVGGTPMLVGDLGREWLHKPGDVKHLAALLEKLISDPVASHHLGAAMRNRVEEYFDIHAVAQTYERAYEKLLQGRRTDMSIVSNSIVMTNEK